MAGMELVEGTYYTPEDLARKREREAAAIAARKANAQVVAEDIVLGKLTISDDRIRAILTELLEPIIEAVEDLETRVSGIEGDAKGDPDTTPEGEDTGDGSSAAEGAAESGSEGVPEKAEPKDVPEDAPAAKTTTRKAVKN